MELILQLMNERQEVRTGKFIYSMEEVVSAKEHIVASV